MNRTPEYGRADPGPDQRNSPPRSAARRVLSLIFSVTQCDATIGPTAGSTAGPAGVRGAPSARADGEWAAGCCPILGAKWERRFTVRCGQTRSDAVSVAASIA